MLIQGLHQVALFIEINSSDTPTIHYEMYRIVHPSAKCVKSNKIVFFFYSQKA